MSYEVLRYTIAQFAFICICFGISLASFFKRLSTKDWALLAFAMAFTVAADYFLILFNNQHMGLRFFPLAHICYTFRAIKINKRHIAAAVCVFAVLMLLPSNIIVFSAIYFIAFCINLIANGYSRHANHKIIIAGLILFALCDVNVLLYNLPRFISFPNEVSDIAFRLIWVFYAPSQFVLSVSGAKY